MEVVRSLARQGDHVVLETHVTERGIADLLGKHVERVEHSAEENSVLKDKDSST